MILTECKTYWRGGVLRYHYYVDEYERQQGVFRRYDEYGILEYKSQNVDSLLHGDMIYFYSSGKIKSREVWINNEFYANYSELSEIDRFELSLKHGIVWFNEV